VSASAADRGDDQLFKPTSGTASGWLGLGLAAVALGAVVLDDRTVQGLRFAIAACIFGLLVWCFLLRPRLVIRSSDLELRNPFTSWHVPLAAVRKVAVRAVTMIYTDERRFDGVAVGRPVRSLARGQSVRQRHLGLPGLGSSRISEGAAASRTPKGQLDANMLADFVVERILESADRARQVSPTPPPPRRSWAWPELAALGLLLVALAVSLVL